MIGAASGIENPGVVDLVSRDKDGAQYSLVMIASEPWDDEKVLALQAKMKSYVSYVEEGQFLQTYPDAKGKRLVFQLSTVHALSQTAESFIGRATRLWLDPLKIAFRVHQLEP